MKFKENANQSGFAQQVTYYCNTLIECTLFRGLLIEHTYIVLLLVGHKHLIISRFKLDISFIIAEIK